MAKVVLVCPFCQKKLETSEENVGREGQCPGCENVLPIRAKQSAPTPGAQVPLAGEGWLAGTPEYEYQDMPALSGAAGVAVCLVLLIVGAAKPWVKPLRLGADFLPAARMVFVACSLACCVFLIVSFLARKSLVPAVLAAAAWGTVAFLWVGGVLHSIHQAVTSARGTFVEKLVRDSVAMRGAVYWTLVAALLLVAASVYFYCQSRDTDTFRRIGLFFVLTHILAALVGLAIVFLHVKPAIEERVPAGEAESAPEARLFEAPPPSAGRPPV